MFYLNILEFIFYNFNENYVDLNFKKLTRFKMYNKHFLN